MATLGPLSSWHNVPILSSPLEPEIIALSWECLYCGSTNPSEALYCGQCGPSHCGASRPEYEEPPRGVLHLQEPELEQFGSFYVIEDPSSPAESADFYADYPTPDSYFYPSNTGVTLAEWQNIRHPGQTAKEHKQAIRARVAAAFQRAIKGAMSLC